MFILLLCVVIMPAMSQDRTIKGNVVDTTSVPISGVTVVMMGRDSTYLNATLTDDNGFFSFSSKDTSFALQFYHISYEDYSNWFISDNVGEIVLRHSVMMIDEVIVKTYRPIVKAEEGKLSYNLKQLSSQTTATNVYEALSYLPGVDEDKGKLSLAGMGAVTVIINGKPSTMSPSQLETLLRSMPTERIKSAEVMYSTPPQYGVRGASINLELEQSRDYSYSGQVNAGYTHQRKNSWGTGGSFVLSTPKWTTDIMYSFNDNYSPQLNEQSSIHTVNDETKYINQKENTYSSGHQHSARAAFDYTPSAKSSLSFVYNGKFNPSQHSVADSDGSYVESLSDRVSSSYLHNVVVRYKAESGFDIGVDYTNYNTSGNGYLNNIYSDGSVTSFDVSSGQNINRLNFFATMEHTLGHGWSLNYGTKSTWAYSKDYQHYSSVVGDIGIIDTDSDLSEISVELYNGFRKKLSKGSLSASVTGEYYNLEGKERWMLYPQANFMWMFNKDNIIQTNISSNKTYPSYWMLQNAISHVDGYTEIHGNPSLRPMTKYSAQFVYIHKRKYVFVLFGSQTNDFFTQNSYLTPDRFALIYKNTNFDFSRQYGITAMIPFRIGEWLNSKATLTGLRMEQISSDYFGSSFDRSAWVGVAKLDNTIKLSNNFSFELNAIYQTPAIQGLFDLGHSWGINAGFKWSLLDKKLDITAKCHDIFESRMPQVIQSWEGQHLEMYTGAYSRIMSLKVSYTFGGYTKKERGALDSSRFGH